MATITSTRRTYKDGLLTSDCECIRIELANGEILRFTNSFNDLEIATERVGTINVALGTPVTYQAIVSPPKPSAVGFSESQAGSMDIEGLFDPSVFTRDAIASGKFNRARVVVFLTNYTSPVDNEEILFSGFWGETTAIDGRYVIKFASLLDALNVDVGRVYSAMCDAPLGSDRCGVELGIPPVWQASTAYNGQSEGDVRLGDYVLHNTDALRFFYWRRALNSGTSGLTEPVFQDSDQALIVDNDITWETFRAFKREGVSISNTDPSVVGFSGAFPNSEFNDYYVNGFVEITSGPNSGSIRRIIGNSETELQISSPFEFPFELGNTCNMTVGCQKRLSEDCDTKFRNFKNFQGFPYMPGIINIRSTGEI